MNGTIPEPSQRFNSPTKSEISSAITRYNLCVRVFGQLIEVIEKKNTNENRWFVFSEKIGRKFLTQAYTLQHIFADDIYIIQDREQKRFIDFSSLFILIRALLETYAVFYHLFADSCTMEEKIIRFRLWELDGLKTRQKYKVPEDSLTKSKIAREREDIDKCISIIKQFRFFENLEMKDQAFLLDNACWRFTSGSLMNKDKNKRRLSIEQMIMNTGIPQTVFDDWYSFSSSHTHTTYWSVIQNDSLTTAERETTEYVAMMHATFITSFFIRDFCRVYEDAGVLYDSLPLKEKQVIDSFDLRNRNPSQ